MLEAFKRYDDGATMKEVVEFSGKGIKNSLGRDMNLNSVSGCFPIVDIMGEYTFRDIVVPDAGSRHCSKELFDRVQEKMAKIKSPCPT